MSETNYDAPLQDNVEVRQTELFSAISLKDDPAKFEGGAKPAAASDAKPAATEEEDDDDFDLFGDDDEEAEKALAEKMAAEKAARKAGKGKGERSLIVLEVKPYDAETDLEVLAKGIKKFEHEGIQNWGKEHKLLPVAFGIKKLAISAVVYDDLMGVDGLSDLIEEKYGDLIQSIDVQAMSKV
ncbi:Elongation factor 1-beta [Hondaea fermentalgiana]|uniref:Elongation factor 1-beta n=1 Tax=Hondaea fermentalgiana TaxID=2315210 RepID=A0A2R5G120_9STRA|nr:Elongation factor 1-beta [Hondaea fermentalgiana]|eukprot:GBG24225.1 Elongation factor 1-beta [Hondaea fermentalgiana]